MKERQHIQVVKDAIEFNNPEWLPMEIIDIPGIYDDYGRTDAEKIEFIPGTENFDAFQACYSWTFRDKGKDENGNFLYEDEWGCLRMLPKSGEYAHLLISSPIHGSENWETYTFPKPEITDRFFVNMEKHLKEYSDRFVAAYIDPGPVLCAIDLLGFEEFLISIAAQPEKAVSFLEKIWEFHYELAKRWKKAGAHMLYLFDEWASQSRLLCSPETWRKYFKPFYRKVFSDIHNLGMYAGLGLDGNVLEILPDLKEVGMDVVDLRQPHAIGLDKLAEGASGKLCYKCSVDMQKTLPNATPEEIKKEAAEIFQKLGQRNGGLIALVYRWATLKLPEKNVIASAEGFNKFRKN